MTPVRLRAAGERDAAAVARLHADSWRRHYRGAYSDAFLDGDVVADREAVWGGRLAAPGPAAVTVVAEDDGALAGFVHVVLDDDERWGSLVDNLHVAHTHRRAGIGRTLMGRAVEVVAERARRPAMYLWVLEQNTSAQHFYRAIGGTCAGTAPVGAPGGDPARLHGTPVKLRMSWPDVTLPRA
ncbi:GNAT family N-acetyltransferase [Actinacidiphila acidipaludis]|uniref:GNAT family N-acetyltransferase n=1 Tax=Actinacidiphila acidipaludis TaxID=2873382 RepID=A0ABS7Q9H1_9ACTN|nr:GNAT family N-acetyltransferase [Streptomyces acidipaludis]MBY8879771.1 GNAT family N-acetyltransferase [Streptomyces acidipaludis]